MTQVASEHLEQVAFARWLTIKKIPFFAIPNGTYLAGTQMQRVKQMAKLKAEGFKAGVADLAILLPNKIVFIEMKRTKGGVVSEHQIEWLQLFNTFSYCEAHVAKGADHAIKIISDIISNLKRKD